MKAGGGSGRDALVVMMRSADLWRLDHAASVGGLDFPRLRAIHFQGQVRSPRVIVDKVVSEDPLEMPFVHHDHLVKAVATERADEPLDERVCQGLRAAMRTSLTPIPRTRLRKTWP